MLTRKQKEILNKIVKGKWYLTPEGLVDVIGDVSWDRYSNHQEIRNFQGIKFGRVTNNFCCMHCHMLESLEGSPIQVDWSYDLDDCHSLRSLEGITQDIGWNLYVQNCKSLYTLKGIGAVGDNILATGTPLIEGCENLSEEEQEAIRSSNGIKLLC